MAADGHVASCRNCRQRWAEAEILDELDAVKQKIGVVLALVAQLDGRRLSAELNAKAGNILSLLVRVMWKILSGRGSETRESAVPDPPAIARVKFNSPATLLIGEDIMSSDGIEARIESIVAVAQDALDEPDIDAIVLDDDQFPPGGRRS